MRVELTSKYIATTIAVSILLLIAAGCSSNNQTVQRRQACPAGDPHTWCAQMAQTQTPGAAPYGLQSTEPANQEPDYDRSYPRNPAIELTTPGIGGLPWGGPIGIIR